MKKRAILFDLDGTVLASKEGIFHSAKYALDRLNLVMPSEEEMLEFLGPPLSIGFATVCRVPADKIEDAVRLYREYYNNGGMFEAYIYEGVRECLEALRGHGVKTYITTSKPQVFARRILEHFGADVAFDGIYGCELDGRRSHKSEVVEYCLKSHGLTPQDVLLVGDRYLDVNGARKCGVDCVGVVYGYGSEKELKDADAAFVVHTANELQTLLLEQCL